MNGRLSVVEGDIFNNSEPYQTCSLSVTVGYVTSQVKQTEEIAVMHLEFIRLLDHHLQAAVLPQNGLPHLSYPAGLLLLSTQLPLCCFYGKKGWTEGAKVAKTLTANVFLSVSKSLCVLSAWGDDRWVIRVRKQRD